MMPKPGSKRLLEHAVRLCPHRPQEMAVQVTEVLSLSAAGETGLIEAINRLVDGLEAILGEEAP